MKQLDLETIMFAVTLVVVSAYAIGFLVWLLFFKATYERNRKETQRDP